jgi:hypothetical protein
MKRRHKKGLILRNFLEKKRNSKKEKIFLLEFKNFSFEKYTSFSKKKEN